MDAKVFKKTLPDEPTEEDYLYWKRMLGIYTARAEVPDDDLLDVLFVLCGARTFPLVEDCATFEAAITRLDSKFIKRSTAIMMRYQLHGRRQAASESVEEYMNELRQLAKKIPTRALTADEHRSLLISDAFIAGLHSSAIRQRLLESSEDTLEELFRTAVTMELATKDAHLITPTNSQATSIPPTVAATNKTTCVWCGGPRHNRVLCPASNSICKKCSKKGHWASVCLSKQHSAQPKRTPRSTTAALDQSIHEEADEPGRQNAVATVLAATSESSKFVTATINGFCVNALIDSGSDLSFVTDSFMTTHRLKYKVTLGRRIALANTSSFQVMGEFDASITIDVNSYATKLLVVKHLIAPCIIGRDILAQHSRVNLEMGGPRKPVTFCLAMSKMNSPLFDLVPGCDLSKCRPISTPSRRHFQHSAIIKSEVSRLLKEDIIQESQSPWRAQCFIVNAASKPRLVIDYSNTINIYTPLDSYPSARIDDILTKVATNSFFSTIDLRSAYHQVPLKPADYKLTAFEACGKLYEFKRLPFGCTNAVAIFQRTMDFFIEKYSLRNTYAYIDDVIIGGSSQEEHDKNLAAFQSAATDFGIQVNADKCRFSQTSISFLGHIISGGQLKPDPSRFEALLSFPTPTSLRQLNSLIGFFAYYAKWIPRCSELTLPLNQAKDYVVKHKRLPDNAIQAIDQLKDALASAALAAPLNNIPLTVEADASENALGGTLLQQGRPVAFLSRSLSKAEKHQSIVEREACAIIECCRKWRHLLLTAPFFTIVTDQKSVSFLFDSHKVSKIKHEKMTRWRLELSEYNFNIEYRPGRLNAAADALSRVSACMDTLESLITLHNKLCHPGVTRLNHYCKVRNLPFSLADIRRVTGTCQICKELKPQFFKPQPAQLLTATRPWERLSMDFVGPLPSTTKNKFLLVIVDEYSRYPFAWPCSSIRSDVVIGHLLHLFSLFGCPSSVHSDRGPQFESLELRRFLLNNGIAKTRTTPYRPQGNGQCERINGSVMKTVYLALRTLGLEKSRWETVLPTALASMRSLLCTATNSTPHDRLMRFPRSSITGTDLPDFLLNTGNTVLLQRHVRSKGDPLVEPVTLVETITPHFARVEHSNGKIDTVSTRHLAPSTPQASPEQTPDKAESDFIASPGVCESEMISPDLTAPQPTSTKVRDSPTPPDVISTRSGRIIKAPERFRPS